ncbi:flagellar protein FliO/FliZ [Bacillus oleivorans]|uniref:Flagellar protein FliO/FliZ n=1 Tax=Bacillus oleivorans TaxID=1448271 RepID=A0A285D1P2_9BACI|nr:flagellar biosynthetic protein FliO [Bacillus oleivorans]SNX73679.1 flagellar protein FliO/FliZ [Bacillus oleivorans]
MKKRRQVIFLFFILFFLGVLPFQTVSTVKADTTSVKEWLENPEQSESPSQTSTEEGAPPAQVGISILDVIKMIFSTVLVITLLLFVLKWVQKKGRNFANHGVIENLGGTTLGNQKSIQLVKIGNRVYIVGVGETVTLLKEIEDEEEIRELFESQQNQPKESVKGWSELFIGKKDTKQDSRFLDSLKNELLKVKQDRKKVIDEWKGKRGQDHHE